MAEKYSVTQMQRLIELNADETELKRVFESKEERNATFRTIELDLVKLNKEHLRELLNCKHVSIAMETEMQFSKWLTEEAGFTRVETPTIISANQLEQMGIVAGHELRDQIFWINSNKCLRPMLATNLYEVMRDIHKVTNDTVRIFEIGSCFRKESQGSKHLNEFRMLNMVELAGTKDGNQMEQLRIFAKDAMKAVGIDNYSLVTEESEVYGQTLDIEANGVEIASGAYGPHPLDCHWGVFDTWVGIGFGIERVAMIKGSYHNIKHVGKSNQFVDGVSLKL